MSQVIAARIQRSIEIATGLTMIVLPRRRQWSRRSASVLAAAGVTLIETGFPTPVPLGGVGRLTRSLSRNRDVIIGVILVAIQYQLTEEESSVRAIIAGIGGALIALGLAMRCFSADGAQLGDVE